MKILGLDPGVQNFAYAVVNFEDLHFTHFRTEYFAQPEVLCSGFMVQMKHFCRDDAFKRSLLRIAADEILELVQIHNVDAVAYERFTFRPGQPLQRWVERLNYALGVFYYKCEVPVYPVVASAWKKKILQKYDIKSSKQFFNGALGTEHEADASLQATYIFEREYYKPPKAPKRTYVTPV